MQKPSTRMDQLRALREARAEPVSASASRKEAVNALGRPRSRPVFASRHSEAKAEAVEAGRPAILDVKCPCCGKPLQIVNGIVNAVNPVNKPARADMAEYMREWRKKQKAKKSQT